VVPPNCLALENLRQRASRIRRAAPKSNNPAIHVHINNPLSDTSRHNISTNNTPGTSGLKRRLSLASEDLSDSDEESPPVFDILQIIDRKYPQLNLPQYMPLLEEQKIVYAETVLEFEVEYFVGLGIPEGAVRPLLTGVRKALQSKKGKKCARRVFNREESLEV
jgi:hypothetical protein